MVVMNRVRVVWTGVAGSPYYSNFYTANGATSPAAAVAAVGVLLGNIKSLYTTALTATTEGDVSQIDSLTDQVVGVTTTTPVAVVGTAAGTQAPYATQGLVRLLTGTYAGGRQIRGRMNIPGVVNTSIGSVGGPTSAYVTAINSAFATYLTALGPSAGVYSRKNKILIPITSATTWSQFAVLRSRRD